MAKKNLTKKSTEPIKNPYQEKKKRKKGKKKRKTAVRKKEKGTLVGLNIARIGAVIFMLLVKRKDMIVFTVLLKKLDDFFNKKK